MDIVVNQKDLEIELPSTEVTLTQAELNVSIEPHYEFSIDAERERPEFCAVIGEIDLTIYGMSLIDWFNKNFAELNLEIINLTTEHNALVQVTLELKAFIENPQTGNTALANLILQLTTEVHDHYNDQSAHSELFLALQSQIIANQGLIEANAGNILALETTVTRHEGEIVAMAETINVLSADIASIESGHTALANAISSLSVIVSDNYGELVAQATRIDQLEVQIDNTITPMLDAHALGIEELQVRVTKNEDGLTALASHTLELVSEIGVDFYPWLAWEFETDLEGWGAFQGTSLDHSLNAMMISGNGGAQISLSPFFGTEYPIVSFIWKRNGDNSNWNGGIWFQCEELSGWILAKSFEDPGGVIDYTHQVVDLTGTSWDGKVITGLAITFANSNTGSYSVDSIGIGRRSAIGSYGSIKKVTESYVGEHFVRVGDFNTYKAQVAGEFGQINTELSLIGDDVEGLTAKWMVELDINGRISGLYMQGNDERTDLKFVVDQFSMYLPGEGDVQIFQAGTFDGQPAILMAGAIIKGVIRSENFRWGYAGQWKGWKLDPNGNFYAAGIQIKDSSGNTILSSGAGINWDPLFAENDFRINVNEHLSPATISQFFEDGSINSENFGNYMESVGIQSAWIGEAVIGTAHIKYLAVDTNQVSQNAVTNIHITAGRNLEPGGESDYIVYTAFVLHSYMRPGGTIVPLVQIHIQITILAEFHYMDGDSTDNFCTLLLKRHDFNSDWTSWSTTLLAEYNIPVRLLYDSGNGGLGIQYTGTTHPVSFSFMFVDGAFNYLPDGNVEYALYHVTDSLVEITNADIVCMELRR